MDRRDFVLVIAALLAACAGPRREAPGAATVVAPATWRASAAVAGARLQADWWKSFDDATLNALVADALSHSDDIAVAATRVQRARADFRYAQAQRMPDIQASMEGGRDRDVNPGFGIPEEQAAGEGLVDASFDVDLFGRLRDSSEAARSTLLAAQDAQYTVRLGIATSVVSGYFTLLALDARLAIVRETVAARREELRVQQRRLSSGYSDALDLTRAQAELDAAEPLIPSLELNIAKTEDGLSILLGHAPESIPRDGTFDRHALPDVPVVLPSRLLRSRPDIAAAEARLAASDHALDAARAAFLPDLKLGLTGGFADSTLVAASPVGLWSISGSILAPLFDAGRLQSQQDVAVAQRDEAAFAYRQTVLQAFREVEDDLFAVAKNREQFEALSRQNDVLRHTLNLATRRYRQGYASYLDQLDAQNNLLSSELSLVQLRLDRFNAAISLIQALGGGWSPNKEG